MRIRKLLAGLLLSVAFAAVLMIGSGCEDSSTNRITPEIEDRLAAALQGWVDDFCQNLHERKPCIHPELVPHRSFLGLPATVDLVLSGRGLTGQEPALAYAPG